MEVKIWKQAPLLRVFIPFLIGIALAIVRLEPFAWLIYAEIILFSLLSLLFFIPTFNKTYQYSWVSGVLLHLLFVVIGYHTTVLNTERLAANYFIHKGQEQKNYLVKLEESPEQKRKTYKAKVSILAVKDSQRWVQTTGHAFVYFSRSMNAEKLAYGDEVIVNTRFDEIQAPKSDKEFNYKKYLSFKNIYHQAFVKTGCWNATGKNSGNILISRSLKLRNHLLKKLSENDIKNDEFAVASALLVGYDDKLSNQVLTAYSATGVLHILSVSGLHVAIIYWVLTILLQFMDKVKNGNIIRALLLILFLWFYAMLTGLSPSVMRAATMLSFVVVGKAINRHSNIYNTLAASAFLLLLINPFLIMDIGFQLSYIAVLGIVYLQPKIAAWISLDNWLLKQIWMITSVSIAAQLATFPLALFYFHQFPNYFLLANLLVVPLSTLVMYWGLFLLLLPKLPVLTEMTAAGFNYCLQFLNGIVTHLGQLPYAVINNISLTLTETLLAYFIILCSVFYFVNKRYRYIVYTLSAIIFVLAIRIINQSGIVVDF